MSIYSDQLSHVQVVINCQYSVAYLCTSEATLAYNLGVLHFDDVKRYNSQQYFFVFQARADKSKNANPRGNNAGPEFPPGLEGFLPQDPFERERMIEDQRRIEQVS